MKRTLENNNNILDDSGVKHILLEEWSLLDDIWVHLAHGGYLEDPEIILLAHACRALAASWKWPKRLRGAQAIAMLISERCEYLNVMEYCFHLRVTLERVPEHLDTAIFFDRLGKHRYPCMWLDIIATSGYRAQHLHPTTKLRDMSPIETAFRSLMEYMMHSDCGMVYDFTVGKKLIEMDMFDSFWWLYLLHACFTFDANQASFINDLFKAMCKHYDRFFTVTAENRYIIIEILYMFSLSRRYDFLELLFSRGLLDCLEEEPRRKLLNSVWKSNNKRAMAIYITYSDTPLRQSLIDDMKSNRGNNVRFILEYRPTIIDHSDRAYFMTMLFTPAFHDIFIPAWIAMFGEEEEESIDRLLDMREEISERSDSE